MHTPYLPCLTLVCRWRFFFPSEVDVYPRYVIGASFVRVFVMYFLSKEDCIVSWYDVLFGHSVMMPSSWNDHSNMYIPHFDISSMPPVVNRRCFPVCAAC